MKSIRLLFVLLSLTASLYARDITVSDLSCENKRNPVGLDELKPRLSWKISGTEGSLMQTAYSIRVATDPRFSAGSIVWESGKVNSGESVLREYDGPAPDPCTRYYWQVRVWDNKGNVSKWSEPGYW